MPMNQAKPMNRRNALKATGAGAGLLLAAGALGAGASAAEGDNTSKGKTMTLTNGDFYVNGLFQADKAKLAYFDMMKRFNYPIVPKLEKEMWVADFSLGDFVNVGMAGIFWWNDKEYSYFGHEIFLLPGQMIVEHAHVKAASAMPKMEAWQVRHGMIHTFGEGDPTTPCPVKLPESQAKYITVRKCQRVTPGEVTSLNRPTAKHFMIAGPEGAIVTEYATYHDNEGLRFTNPGVKF
jgi:D-lyxose ketol-isomerase